MKLLRPQLWLNFLSLLPGTVLTLLTIGVAFLRFYDEQDFSLLGYITDPRAWSNRLTLAALLVAVVNFGVEWNRRNRETDRLAQAEQRRAEEEQRRTQERERAARRARIEARCRAAEIRFQLDPSLANRRFLEAILAVLEEYGETL
ncbi:hypothetical protein NEA10_04960 [Phormidium yuhuli AB48]|uniref:Uncharacterized protein n=1 Tax=Phormidium yuhuli AB48 TaxID=2940671 RepID=A0ABY5ATI4_9CYAN|nr:hypothetical protein [Phormidium yuhuli]USR92076.1 hypothetical protein NEA10_04960 [Phormidium yuhuli AB48]